MTTHPNNDQSRPEITHIAAAPLDFSGERGRAIETGYRNGAAHAAQHILDEMLSGATIDDLAEWIAGPLQWWRDGQSGESDSLGMPPIVKR